MGGYVFKSIERTSCLSRHFKVIGGQIFVTFSSATINHIWCMAFAWWLVPCLSFPGLPHIYFLLNVWLGFFLCLLRAGVCLNDNTHNFFLVSLIVHGRERYIAGFFSVLNKVVSISLTSVETSKGLQNMMQSILHRHYQSSVDS